MTQPKINTIIFDLGGVLVDWNPEYVFLDAFKGDREKMNRFFENICIVIGTKIKMQTIQLLKELQI